jgi:TPP-dependent pyruvate/acetoin dehydrogenase alpha subunit
MAVVVRRVQAMQQPPPAARRLVPACGWRCRMFSAAVESPLTALRAERADEIAQLAEVVQRERFQRQLNEAACQVPAGATQGLGGMSVADAELALDAGFLTFLTHVESRVSSAVGQGFYTIGPCGEELMAAVGCALRPTDAMALHYRHLATQIARQLRNGRSVEQVLLDRARGHVVSASDPVTGGVHCSIGGGPTDFIVSSTLASQCPQAVGRALGNQLAHGLPGVDREELPLPRDAVSLVSVGDGSVNNGHFLSAVNLAGYARHRGYKCPTVFVVTDNEICISLRGHGWIDSFVSKLHMPLHTADGMDLASVYDASSAAIEYARGRQTSVCLLVENVPRRFGHAATDRQAAYLTGVEISEAQQSNPLEGAVAQLVAAHGGPNSGVAAELAAKFARFTVLAEQAFDVAAAEDKITDVNHMISMSSAPLACIEPALPSAHSSPPTAKQQRPAVMRKHMTSVIAETLDTYPAAVYLGEDVEHGGYYLVTDGLAKAFPNRVRDFPPDETSLVGAAIGFSQVGLLPVRAATLNSSSYCSFNIVSALFCDLFDVIDFSMFKCICATDMRDSLCQVLGLWVRSI